MVSPTTTRAHARALLSRNRRRRRIGVAFGAIAAAVAVGVAAAALGSTAPSGSMNAAAAGPAASPTSPAATPVPSPTPLTASQELLASTDDPSVCAVAFDSGGIPIPPVLQRQGALYEGLPIPHDEGRVFAGWYATPEDAAAHSILGRVNGSELVVCTGREITLFGGWKTPEENAAEESGIPILMYHQFTPKPEGEPGWLRGNYAYIGDFDAHMEYIDSTGFYLPTWDELSAFIDGRLYLPSRSVIVTDDDADQTWFDLAVPVIDRHGVLATSFMVTAHRQDPAPSPYVLRRSHTHDMHSAGANGEGRIVNWTIPEIVADMEASGQVLGVKEVMAYPFGHHNATAQEALRQAGWNLARTIQPGYVRVGTEKLALPTVRVDYGMNVDALIELIG